MEDINEPTLRKLLSFIKSVKGPKVRDDDDFAPQRRAPKPATAAKPKKNKPMGKEEQENKIKQIRQQLQNFDANASNSDQSPPGKFSLFALIDDILLMPNSCSKRGL